MAKQYKTSPKTLIPFSMKKKFSKNIQIWLIILVLLVVVRLLMPYFIVKYVNKVLAKDIAPYKGHIYDVDLSLY
jgi:hypothetical protein